MLSIDEETVSDQELLESLKILDDYYEGKYEKSEYADQSQILDDIRAGKTFVIPRNLSAPALIGGGIFSIAVGAFFLTVMVLTEMPSAAYFTIIPFCSLLIVLGIFLFMYLFFNRKGFLITGKDGLLCESWGKLKILKWNEVDKVLSSAQYSSGILSFTQAVIHLKNGKKLKFSSSNYNMDEFRRMELFPILFELLSTQ